MEAKGLTPEHRHVMEERGTEPAFRGRFWKHKERGEYCCARCGQQLFGSESKFDSGTGWPSFYQAHEGSVEFMEDRSHGMLRTEAVCSRCKAHLGHFFRDGPKSSRYCINSLALDFKAKS